MKKKCPNCHLVNFPYSIECERCRCELVEIMNIRKADTGAYNIMSKIIKRGVILVGVCIVALLGFYLSLIMTSSPLTAEQRNQVETAIDILENKGFADEVFLLRHLTTYRSNDNWLNASTREENAFAATNYPFEIMTVYPDFFEKTTDDIERAAILLHEAKHLQGEEEKEAYAFVWENKKKLGWTKEKYIKSPVWRNVRRQTRDFVPNIFVCNFNEFQDCSE